MGKRLGRERAARLAPRMRMKEKEPRILELSDVLAKIQAFLDEEAKQSRSSWEALPRASELVQLSDTRRSVLPAAVAVTQFYLLRHPDAHSQIIESLPPDMFIVC
jgi:hypothetical protein